MALISDKFIEANKTFLKSFLLVVDSMQNHSNMQENLALIFCLIEKFKENPDLMNYLFGILKKFTSMKKFKEIVNIELLNSIFSIISSTSSQSVANMGLQILDTLVKTLEIRELMRSSKPLIFVVKLLKRFKDDNLLSFHAGGFLSKILEKEDIYIFLKIMNVKSLKKIGRELQNDIKFQGTLTEIKDLIENYDEEYFNSFKKNITRVLILMSKDKNFLQLLKELNSLNVFTGILKADLDSYSSEKNNQEQSSNTSDDILLIENMLPDLIRLILSLLKHYDLEYDVEFNNFSRTSNHRSSICSGNSISLSNPFLLNNSSIIDTDISINTVSNPLKDIYTDFFKYLLYFNNDKQIVYDILDYLSGKEKKIIEDILKDLDFNEITSSLKKILKIYHNNKWLYQFLNKLFSFQVYSSITDFDFVIIDVKNLNTVLANIKAEFSEDKKENFIDLIYQTSLNFIISSFGNFNFNENSFQEFHFFTNNLINFILENSFMNPDKDVIHSLITLLFSSIENKNFGQQNIEEKCKLVISFLQKITFELNLYDQSEESFFSSVSNYIMLRFSRFIDLRIENINKYLYNNEEMCNLILYVLPTINSQDKKKTDESLTRDTFLVIIHILNLSDRLQISKFLRDNGFILLMRLFRHCVYDFDINKLIITIINSFSNIHFRESALIFKNFFNLKNFINQLKEFKFSKGINEKIYYEILVFLKNIIKSCEYCEAAEETLLIDHLVNEYNEIFSFYDDSKNRILEIISEILSTFSKEKVMLKSLLNSRLPVIIEKIFKNISENSDKTGHDKIIEHLVDIFFSFFKSKEYSKLIYNNYKVSLEIIKNITFNSQLTENCLIKLLSLCHVLVEYENSEIIKEKILSTVYFKELSMNLPSSQKAGKEMIEKCISTLENPVSDKLKKTLNEFNSQFIKELSDLVKADRKNAFRKKESVHNYKSDESKVTKEEIPAEEAENIVNSLKTTTQLRRRKSLININDNPNLKNHFNKIIDNINLITDLVIEPDRRDSINIERESEQLSDFIKMLCIFSKHEDNIKKISETSIIDKLILIIDDNNDILAFTKDQVFNLLQKLSDDDDFINKLFENGKACEFFLKELKKIGKIYFPETSQYVRNKVAIVTKIISKLSAEKIFVLNNSEYLSIGNIFNIISSIQCDKDIILNILSTFNNILINNASINFTGFNISSIIQNLWKQYSEIRVIEKIMKIIENLYLDENIIKELIEFDIVENINEVLRCPKTDSDGIINILELINILMFHRHFASKIIEQKTLDNILKTISNNMFNTRIVEKGCSIFSKGAKADKNFITILGVYGVKEFCLQILSKYMTTCHSSIIKQILELIFILISDENNLVYFSKGESINIMLKTFKANLKIKEHVLLSLKLINVITTKDVELKVERARERRRTLEAMGKAKSALIKISSVTAEDDVSITYDFTILIEIINEILFTYDEFIDIIMQLCELINNIFKISNEIWLKKFMMSVIVNNADKYLVKQNYIEIFLKTIYQMIKADKSILDEDSASILYYISKLLSVKLNYNILLSILKILKHVIRSKNVNSTSTLLEIIKIMKFVEENKYFHNDQIIILFSHILGYLCVNTSFYKEASNQFIVFLLEYLISRTTDSDIHSKMLEDLKNISVYFQINNSDTSKKVAELMKNVFELNFKDQKKKNLINIFQIISSLCIQSEELKIELNEIHFHTYLKDLLNQDKFNDNLIDYQAKGCLLNLKLKKTINFPSKMTISSTLRSMSIAICEVEVKDEVKSFLKQERIVKIYTEKGEAKERFLIMNENLDKIISYAKKKNSYEILEEMSLKDMDSCVRSCGTAAFSKAKGFFTKKPKPARCFSILGIKTLQGQKTFNVECDKEDDCIKYVDYISILIQNNKSIREDLNYDSNRSAHEIYILK